MLEYAFFRGRGVSAVIAAFLVLLTQPFKSMAEQTTNIDWNNLSPINPEIMQYQATINIGSSLHVRVPYA